jgi:hypothetical protein
LMSAAVLQPLPVCFGECHAHSFGRMCNVVGSLNEP